MKTSPEAGRPIARSTATSTSDPAAATVKDHSQEPLDTVRAALTRRRINHAPTL